MMALKKKIHPTFARMNYGRTKRSRVKDNWRKPRGTDNKQRLKLKYAGSIPRVGWKNAAAVRGLHPSGFAEARVFCLKDLTCLDPKRHAVRIASAVGSRKRALLAQEAGKKGFKLLN